MARCANCGRKAGGFSLRAFNDISGRCDECDRDVEEKSLAALDKFRSAFQHIARSGTLTQGNWISLEKSVAEEGLDFSEIISSSFIE